MRDGSGPPRPSVFRVLVPVTALAAGLLFATSASTAHGTDLRGGRRQQVTDLISAERDRVSAGEAVARGLRAEVDAASRLVASQDSRVAAGQEQAAALAAEAGVTPVLGPGLSVRLTDAPLPVNGQPPASSNPDDLVVHQQDLQAVVNALWAGGAEAMTLMGQRVVSTSAVRCVGNTVILHGRVYGPPFVVAAIGDVHGMRRALDAEPGVRYFRTFVDRFGLGYRVRESGSLHLPAFDGSLDLPHVARGGA
ncbi:MAG: DUF881 domain-containing protein [Actinomycetota bacterium]|nr:DUF881 domain-containing protein [Actinomycetota bacterium]